MATLPPAARQDEPFDVDVENRYRGWALFAGTMLAVVGVLNFIYGAAAVSESSYYVRDARYVLGDLQTWGWFLIVLGAVQGLAAASIWRRTGWGRWVGIASASVNAVIQALAMAGAPLLSLALFAADILIIYGLFAYGGRRERLEA
jgi:hypothetical protein